MKRILILTTDNDTNITDIMKWLYYLDKTVNVIRLNIDELFDNYHIEQVNINAPINLTNSNICFGTNEISVVWPWKLFRKQKIVNNSSFPSPKVTHQINSNSYEEERVFLEHFAHSLSTYGSIFINPFRLKDINKLEQLYIANKIGLKIPNTILTSSLNKFSLEYPIITKPLSNCFTIQLNDKHYSTYTSRVDVGKKNKDFSVSLFQKEIIKELELRVLYIDQKCYTVSIITKSMQESCVDYRNYNYSKPYRFAYYTLPTEITKKICSLMNHFNLKIGSLDFILDENGEYYFLEINQSGQYGILGFCNIYPDKIIAEFLLKKHYECIKK